MDSVCRLLKARCSAAYNVLSNSTRGDLPILPKQAGSYQFIDADGVIIYVGKAVNIKSRVNSYFGKAVDDKWSMCPYCSKRI